MCTWTEQILFSDKLTKQVDMVAAFQFASLTIELYSRSAVDTILWKWRKKVENETRGVLSKLNII